MNKLIKALENNSLKNDTLKDLYGVSTREHFDCIFVAPSWTPEKVFDTDKIKVEQIFSGRFANTFRIHNGNKKYLLVTLFIGAPNIIDFCLMCYKTKCDNFVFLGSVGALVPDIKIGDIIAFKSHVSLVTVHKITNIEQLIFYINIS